MNKEELLNLQTVIEKKSQFQIAHVDFEFIIII
jgi:hypothetical protein